MSAVLLILLLEETGLCACVRARYGSCKTEKVETGMRKEHTATFPTRVFSRVDITHPSPHTLLAPPHNDLFSRLLLPAPYSFASATGRSLWLSSAWPPGFHHRWAARSLKFVTGDGGRISGHRLHKENNKNESGKIKGI